MLRSNTVWGIHAVSLAEKKSFNPEMKEWGVIEY